MNSRKRLNPAVAGERYKPICSVKQALSKVYQYHSIMDYYMQLFYLVYNFVLSVNIYSLVRMCLDSHTRTHSWCAIEEKHLWRSVNNFGDP